MYTVTYWEQDVQDINIVLSLQKNQAFILIVHVHMNREVCY